MAGRVRIRLVTLPPNVMQVYPEQCPANPLADHAPMCVLFPGDLELIRACPLMYGSEAWIQKGWSRHRDNECFGMDLDLHPGAVSEMRVLCAAAPANGTPPGVVVRTSKGEERSGA